MVILLCFVIWNLALSLLRGCGLARTSTFSTCGGTANNSAGPPPVNFFAISPVKWSIAGPLHLQSIEDAEFSPGPSLIAYHFQSRFFFIQREGG